MSVYRSRPWPAVTRPERRRDDVAIVREVADAAAAINNTAKGWLAFLPLPAAIEAMRNNVAGIGRLLTELTIYQENEHGGK